MYREQSRFPNSLVSLLLQLFDVVVLVGHLAAAAAGRSRFRFRSGC